jgi:hypothetical protein
MKGCNDVHFDSIRDKKKFANGAGIRQTLLSDYNWRH